MRDTESAVAEEHRHLVRRTAAPAWIVPMAATLTHERFDDPDWLFEQKLDGIRCLAFVRDGTVNLFTRNRLPIQHPEVSAALAAHPADDFVLDGEMVAHVGERSGFALRGQPDARTDLHVFDVLRLDACDLTRLPLTERKRLLTNGFTWTPPLRLVEELECSGLAAYERACREGWEGVIAKRRDSEYEHRRSKAWLKMKCEASQELVVGGFTDPKGARTSFGALLVGYYDSGDFVYAGKVGTGFDSRKLRELKGMLDPLRVDEKPFTRGTGLPRKDAQWVLPQIVVQVGFMEWTGDGKLRHPRFLGIREDKPARDVVRES